MTAGEDGPAPGPGPVEVQVLGDLVVSSDGATIDLTGDRQRRAVLALAAAGAAGADHSALAEVIWEDHDRPADVASHLRTLISRLRVRLAADHPGLEPAIAGRPGGYRFDEDRVTVDLWRFEAELARAESEPDPRHRQELLDAILPTSGGDPYMLFADLTALSADAARRSDRWLDAEQDRLELWLAGGRDGAVIDRCGELLASNPYRERLRSLEVLALYRSGRQAEALRRLGRHRQTMTDDLGLDPAPELVDLELKVLNQDEGLLAGVVSQGWIRGYVLGDELSRSDHAIVYRGEQPSIGRTVTIEVVTAGHANQPAFMRHFEAEAQRFAGLEHPNLVPLYDYWREPDRACLVYPAYRARSLTELLQQQGPLTEDACRRLVTQIGAALSVVHEAGVAHGDVGPAAVFVDSDSNFFLGRFPIATRALNSETGGEGDRPTISGNGSQALLDVDLQGIGHLVERARATATDPRPRHGSSLDLVLDDLAGHRPSERFASMAQAGAALVRALDGPPGTGTHSAAAHPPKPRRSNPYRGLRPFAESDHRTFFGREELVDRMLGVLNRAGPSGRILAVVGPSGIGKSSTVMAGLVPAVRAGEVRAAENWFVTTMTPGREPFTALASALLRVSASASAVAEARLRRDRNGLARAVDGLLGTDDAGLLLVIDQFEELFTSGGDQEELRLFLDAIDAVVTEGDDRFQIVITIRADYWHAPLQHPRFANLIESSTVHVRSMEPTELERAIVEPARALEIGLEEGLLSSLVADVSDQVGGLPLAQLALAELWDRMPEGASKMTLDAYRELGGVAGAAAAVADKVYLEIDEADRGRIRTVFGRLATPVDGGPITRRRVRRADIGAGPVITTVLERFGQARLLSFDREPHSRDPTVEIAHEALLDSWPRLRQWLDEDRATLLMLRRLGEAAEIWRAGGLDEAGLYRGGRLEAVEAWMIDQEDAELSAAEAEFVAASVAAREARDDVERTRLTRLRRGLLAMAAVAFVAVLATILAVQQRRSAVAAAYRSDSLVIIRAAEALAATNPELALQLAVTAVDRDEGSQSRQALVSALQAEPRFDGVVERLGDVHCWSWTRSSDSRGPLLVGDAALGSERTIRYSPGRGLPEQSQTVSATVPCPRIDPLADRALVVGNDRLDIVSFGGGTASLELPVTVAGWAADGSSIVSLGRVGGVAGDWRLRVHDREDLSVEIELTVDAVAPLAVDYVPEAERVLILESGVGGRRSSIVELAEGEQILLDHRAPLRNAVLSADGRLAVGVDERQLHLWDATTGGRDSESVILVGDGTLSAGLAINPGGTIVAVTTGAGVELYDMARGEAVGPALATGGRLRFEGESRLLVGTADNSIHAYELDRDRLSRRLFDWEYSLGIVAPDGSIALAGSSDEPLGFDLESGDAFPIPTINARAIAGGRIVGYDSESREYFLIEEGSVALRSDLAEAVPAGLVNMRMPRAEYGRVLLQLFDPGDGEMSTNRLLVLDASTGELLGVLEVPGVFLSEFLSPDEILVSRQSDSAQILGIDGTVRYEFPALDSQVTAGDALPDGDLVLGLMSGTTIIWSSGEQRIVETLVGPSSFVVRVLPVDDGVIVQHASGEILQWRWGATEPAGQLVGPGDFGGLAHLSPDGGELVVPIGRGIEAFPISVDRWREEACARISSSIDEEGWRAATGLEPPAVSACD